MNLKTFRALRPQRKLVRSSIPLDSLGGTLNIVGQFIFNIYVARGPTVSNLLGRETAVEMGLVKRVEQVSAAAGHQETLKTGPAVHTPRRVLLPLLPKVQTELQRMEEQGVIERVMQPTNLRCQQVQ